MSKHTPGPWRVDGEYLSSRVDVGPADGVSIFEACCSAYIAGSQDEEIANACLIVAAPEMYELLNKIRTRIDSTCRECESKAIVPEIDALLDKIEEGGKAKRLSRKRK